MKAASEAKHAAVTEQGRNCFATETGLTHPPIVDPDSQPFDPSWLHF